MTVAIASRGLRMGRGQSPTAGRKVEAGPQAGELPVSVATNPVPEFRGEREPERRRLRRNKTQVRPTLASCGGWSACAFAQHSPQNNDED